MTSENFRRIALSFPETTESSHMNHPDFRVRGKIFATLYPDARWGVVMLTLRQQEEFCSKAPRTFVPVKGGWGRRGCTQVLLKTVKASTLKTVLKCAFCNKAPKELRAATPALST